MRMFNGGVAEVLSTLMAGRSKNVHWSIPQVILVGQFCMRERERERERGREGEREREEREREKKREVRRY